MDGSTRQHRAGLQNKPPECKSLFFKAESAVIFTAGAT